MNWLHAFAGLSLLFAFALQFPCSSASLDTGKAEGETLAGALRSQKPVENAEFTGILKTRDAQGRRIETVLRFRAVLHETSWDAVYEAHLPGEGRAEKLVVVHTNAAPNYYLLARALNSDKSFPEPRLCPQVMIPFAGSDFWLADLGLEFFHWPEQNLKKPEMRRGRPCQVLESINPKPSAGGYSRVLSWVDSETHGLLRAEAYDSNGKLLKEFAVGSFKKIKDRWELQEMEIRNVQTDSRTRLDFDLGE